MQIISCNQIEDIKERFLFELSESKGNIDEALEKINKTRLDLSIWSRDEKFRTLLKQLQRAIIEIIKIEYQVLAHRKLLELMQQGFRIERTIRTTIELDLNGEEKKRTIETNVKKTEVTIADIKQAIGTESDFIQIINGMAKEGLLTEEQYHNVINKAEAIREEILLAYRQEANNKDQTDKDTAIALLQQAFIQGLNKSDT